MTAEQKSCPCRLIHCSIKRNHLHRRNPDPRYGMGNVLEMKRSYIIYCTELSIYGGLKSKTPQKSRSVEVFASLKGYSMTSQTMTDPLSNRSC